MTLKEHPDCDKEALQEQYPLVNVPRYVEKLKTRHTENLRGTTVLQMKLLKWRFSNWP
jgi:hypothetical protein